MQLRDNLLFFGHRTASPDSWWKALRLPRVDRPAELSFAAQSIELLRPLLPILGIAALCHAALLTWLSWPQVGTVGFAWNLVNLIVFLPVLLAGDFLNRQLRANPVSGKRNLSLAGVVIGLLWGSSLNLFGESSAMAATIACAMLGLIVFAAVPLTQMAFVLSFAAGLVLFTPEAVLPALFAVAVISIAIGSAASSSFGRMRGALALHRDRLARAREQDDSFTWATNRHGAITSADNKLLKLLSLPAGAVTGRAIWALSDGDTQMLGDARDQSARVLQRLHDIQAPFSEVVTQAAGNHGSHRLMLSGEPIYDAFGTFCGFRGVGVDLTTLHRKQEQLLEAAERDTLTRLMNRGRFNQYLEQRLGGGSGPGCATALLLIDLDKFKQANDTLGHQTGDQVLVHFADRLRTFIRDRGVVGRLGGDEFGVILHEISKPQDIDALCRDLIPYLSAPYRVGGISAQVGATVGVAICPEHGVTVDALVRSADLALYSAKARGGGTHRFYHNSLLEHALERRRLEIDLGHAIKQGQLCLRYQPIVDAQTERLCGFEALVAWDHPERGCLAPDEFIPLAEASGLIGPLGEWVLQEACATAARWPANIRLAVNLSPTQFSDPGLASFVVKCLEQTGMAPERLELEITESVLLEQSDGTRAALKYLHEIGVRWALDDFGTGYSSLNYLLKAPFAKIKIDREFVNGVSVEGSQKRPIVETIVSLAKSMNLKTTAEGVESENDFRMIKSLGCSEIQGFIFGPKLTAAEAESLAKSRMPIPCEGYQATRCEPRFSVLRSADVVFGDTVEPATVRNVSANGAMFEAKWEAEIGMRLEVFMDHAAPRKGTVCWVDGNRFGVQFDRANQEQRGDAAISTYPTMRLAG